MSLEAKIEKLEWSLISGKPVKEEAHLNVATLVSKLIDGQYENVLTSNTVRLLLGSDLSSETTVLAREAAEESSQTIEISTYISRQLQLYFQEIEEFNHEHPLVKQLQVLCIAVSFINAFVQTGWTGPVFELEPQDILPKYMRIGSIELNKRAIDSLEADGEQAYHLTPNALFLLIARTILVDNISLLKDLKTKNWWAMRALFLQQRILDNNAASLRRPIIECIGSLETSLPDFSEEIALVHVRYHIECGFIYHYYNQDALALDHFVKAQRASGLKWKITGALGRRTRFQTFDVSQLLLVASSHSNNNIQPEESRPNKLPDNLPLDDDTLLEKIKFRKYSQINETMENEYEADEIETNPENQSNLKIIDQCILLAFCLNIKNTNPAHGITTEQMIPYVSRVLENPNNWMVHTMALLLRSRLEKEKSRTVERSALQLQALVDQFPLEISSAHERIEYFYQILLPSKWDMEKELGERFMSLGVVRSALEIFERLEMWEEVIHCYVMLGKEEKAKGIIHERLKITPKSPKLYCILGDIEKDPKHWEYAWEISNYRFARAMRSLGSHWFQQQQYQKSIDCYKKALQINPLFENSWFIQGCAAMRIDDWDIAINAFLRVITIDSENSEAWNNLASIFLKQDRKMDAFNAFQQALKQNYDNWKVWTNYMYTAIDIGEFSEAIRAMQRVVDLLWQKEKEKCVDIEVLEIIVNSVTQGILDADKNNVKFLVPKVERLLFEGITSRVTNNPKIWRICGNFWFSQKRYDLTLEALLKAYRCFLHDPRLETSAEVFDQAATAALEVVETYQNLGELKVIKPVDQQSAAATNATEIKSMGNTIEELVCKDWRYQAKSLLRTLIGRTKNSFEGSEMHDKLKKALKDLSI
ncbi:hypothetical protein G9A89_013032 [Geosiphon pyriformis]|nr:hypothetical protein G9A89_013032 [Geosiphon pyriformis]